MTDPPAPWQVGFYECEDGGCPVEDFLNGLGKPPRAKLLHGFIKRSPKTPEQDIRIAEARMTEYLERQKRVEP